MGFPSLAGIGGLGDDDIAWVLFRSQIHESKLHTSLNYQENQEKLVGCWREVRGAGARSEAPGIRLAIVAAGLQDFAPLKRSGNPPSALREKAC